MLLYTQRVVWEVARELYVFSSDGSIGGLYCYLHTQPVCTSAIHILRIHTLQKVIVHIPDIRAQKR